MVWADIAMYFIEDFPRIDDKSVVLTVVDRFSKYAHFIPLGNLYTTVSVAMSSRQHRQAPWHPVLHRQRP
jgi:hypothetical protein